MVSVNARSGSTLHRVNADGTVRFTVNYFHDQPVTSGIVYDCAVDSNGNFYQVGQPTFKYPTSGPQVTTARSYTLRSWTDYNTAAHKLWAKERWAWSNCPNGVVGGTYNITPPALLGCKISFAGADEVVVVSDSAHWKLSGIGIIPLDTANHTLVTALKCSDGSQVWQTDATTAVGLVSGTGRVHLKVVGSGPTRTLLAPYSTIVGSTFFANGGFVTLDSSNGALVCKCPWQPVSSVAILAACMDTDDSVYALVLTAKNLASLSQVANSNYCWYPSTAVGIAHFPKDSIYPTSIVVIPDFGNDSSNSSSCTVSCSYRLGMPLRITVNGTNVTVAGQYGVAEYAKSGITGFDRLAPSSSFCLPLSTKTTTSVHQDMDSNAILYPPTTGFFYDDNTHMGFTPYAASPTNLAEGIFNSDGTKWKAWQDTFGYAVNPLGAGLNPAARFKDAIALPDGGALWSQDLTCYQAIPQNDSRTFSYTCPTLCYDECFKISSIGSYTITTPSKVIPSGPGAGTTVGPQALTLTDLFATLTSGGGGCRTGVGLECDWSNPAGYYTASVGNVWDLTPGAGTFSYLTQYVCNLSLQVFGNGTATLGIGLILYQYTINPSTGRISWTVQATVNTALQCSSFTSSGGTFTAATPGSISGSYGWGYSGGSLGGAFTTVNSTPFDSGVTVVNASCNQSTSPSTATSCTGSTPFIANGSLAWVQIGPSNCRPGCLPTTPVTAPTTVGQYTTTPCG